MVARCWPCCTCIWVWLSVINAVSCCIAFYMPFWLVGYLPSLTHLHRPLATYFGSFRRCTFPRIDSDGRFEIVEECGRYATFNDIPTWPWQVTTVCCGLGCGISLFTAAVAATAWCFNVDWSRKTFRSLGALHLAACVLTLSGLAFFPFGWLDNAEVNIACTVYGDSPLELFYLGHCRLWWSFYVLLGSTAVSLFLSLTSCWCCNCFCSSSSTTLDVTTTNQAELSLTGNDDATVHQQQKPFRKASTAKAKQNRRDNELLLQMPQSYTNGGRILVDDRGLVQPMASDVRDSKNANGKVIASHHFQQVEQSQLSNGNGIERNYHNDMAGSQAQQHNLPPSVWYSSSTNNNAQQQAPFRPDPAHHNMAPSTTTESIAVSNIVQNSYGQYQQQQQQHQQRRQFIV